jgi:hypothetical protein
LPTVRPVVTIPWPFVCVTAWGVTMPDASHTANSRTPFLYTVRRGLHDRICPDPLGLNGMDRRPYSYLRERAEAQRAWYDKEANRCKRKYMNLQRITVLVAALVPVATIFGRTYPMWWNVAVVLALTAGIVVAYESVMHYREQWKNYRSTEQFIKCEIALFRSRAGVYRRLERDGDASAVFAERIEDAIAAEGAATLNTMTVPLRDPGVRAESGSPPRAAPLDGI